MSVAGKKDKLAAGGRTMLSAGGIGDSPFEVKRKKIAAGKMVDPSTTRHDPKIEITKPTAPKMKFIPKNGHLLVRRDEANALSTTIVLAESVEKEQPSQGIVLESNVVDITIGTHVVFGKYAGTEYRLNGEVLLIMRESDVQGLLVRADEDDEVETSVTTA